MLLKIEKLIYGGDGLARLPAHSAETVGREVDRRTHGKAVFMPFVLPGEQIEASVTQQKPGFARAETRSIIEPSPHRVAPSCPYFSHCGGCHYQHTSYERQLEIKKEILSETLRRTAKVELAGEIEVHPSPPWNYRNRSRLQLQAKPAFALGYFKHSSHQLQSVEQCPISSHLINRAIATMWQIGRSGEFPDGVREVEFFANSDDSQLLVEFSCNSDARRKEIRKLAEDMLAAMPEMAGVAALRESQPSNTRAGRLRSGGRSIHEKVLSLGASHLLYRSELADYRVSAGSFFQTNRYLTDELVRIVVNGRSGGLALDLYGGVGLFSTVLARDFRHIVSVESSQTSSADLSYNLPSNGLAVQATVEQYLIRAEVPGRVEKGAILHTSHSPDLAVVDPPRSGLGERVSRLLANLGPARLTYVSCDPATLARDLVHLFATGYRMEQIHLVDLFPQTYHMETVVHLAR